MGALEVLTTERVGRSSPTDGARAKHPAGSLSWAGVYRVCDESCACAREAQMCSFVRKCVQRATGQAAVADVPAVAVACDCLGFCWARVRVRTPPPLSPLRMQACVRFHS